MARQDQFEKRKERNLKKLTKEKKVKERLLSPTKQLSSHYTRKASSKKSRHKNATSSGSIELFKGRGQKDAIVNTGHLRAETEHTLDAFQTLTFGPFSTRNNIQNSATQEVEFSQQQLLHNQRGLIKNSGMQSAASFQAHPSQYQQVTIQQTTERLYQQSEYQPGTIETTAAAIQQEQILDEFTATVPSAQKNNDNRPQNKYEGDSEDENLATRVVSHGPKLDYSRIDIQSKVPQSIANLFTGPGFINSLQEESSIDVGQGIKMIPPLSGKTSAGFSILQQQQSKDELQNVEKFFTGARRQQVKNQEGSGDKDPSSIPSRINSRAGSNFVSHSLVGLKPQQNQQAVLETTQVILKQPIEEEALKRANLIRTFEHNSQSNNQLANLSYMTKGIEILDSEFAPEKEDNLEYANNINQSEAYLNKLQVSRQDSKSNKKRKHTQTTLKKNKIQVSHRLMHVPDHKLTRGQSASKQQPAKQLMTKEKRYASGAKIRISRFADSDVISHQNQMTSQITSQRNHSLEKEKQQSYKVQQRQINAKATAQAQKHLQKLEATKRIAALDEYLESQKKILSQAQHKTARDELYLSNKLTRQFIMVTSLVMQSEDLSEDSIFNYAQFTEFAIRFGMMNERAAIEESDERALLYEMWCTLSRVHSDFAFIRVVNLKTMITANLGFPVAVHRNPYTEVKNKKPMKKSEKVKIVEHDQSSQSDEQEKVDEGESSGFEEADEDQIPSEDGNTVNNLTNQDRHSRQPMLTAEKSAGKASRETEQSYYDGASLSHLAPKFQHSSTKRKPGQTHSIIDEVQEFKEDKDIKAKADQELKGKRQDSDSEEEKYFFDHDDNENDDVEPQQSIDHSEAADSGEGDEDEEDGQTLGEIGTGSHESEFAIDRAHKIGFFVEHFEFCMTMKDVLTVQRRFRLFYKNWRDFQNKDLVVKKSVIVNDGATFHPQINKKSEQILNHGKAYGEFPMARVRSADRRQRVWERELPRGVKSKERIYQMPEASEERGNWLVQSEQNFTANGLPFCQNVNSRELLTREGILAIEKHRNKKTYDDYFTVGDQQQQQFYSSVTSKNSSIKSNGKKQLTYPRMTQRMEHIYQMGRIKAITRQDQEVNAREFNEQEQNCTFQPQISQTSHELSSQQRSRCFSIEQEKPWLQSQSSLQEQNTHDQEKHWRSQQQLAHRMQFAIEKDITRRKIAQREKQIKNAVMNHGGWVKDYDRVAWQAEIDPTSAFKQGTSGKSMKKNKVVSAGTSKEMQSYMSNSGDSADQNIYQSNYHTPQALHLTSEPTESTPKASKVRIVKRSANQKTMNLKTKKKTGQISQQKQRLAFINEETCQGGSFTGSFTATKNRVTGSSQKHSVVSTNATDLQLQISSNPVTVNITTTAATPPTHTDQQLAVIQETASFENYQKTQQVVYSESVVSLSTLSKKYKSGMGKPLVIIEVDTNGPDEAGGIQKIEVYRGDDPERLAMEFCQQHEYDENTCSILQRQIEEKLARAYAKLEAKMNEKKQNRLAEKFRQIQSHQIVYQVQKQI